jgi:hypothetical protein
MDRKEHKMVVLNFAVQTQVLKRMDRQILATNSAEFHKATFEFSSEWDGLEKTAVFSLGGEDYAVMLDENDSCTVPFEVMHGDRNLAFEVSVFGNGVNTVLTSSVEAVAVVRGSKAGGAIPAFTPDMYTQIMTKIEEIEIGQIDPDAVALAVESYLADRSFLTYSD